MFAHTHTPNYNYENCKMSSRELNVWTLNQSHLILRWPVPDSLRVHPFMQNISLDRDVAVFPWSITTVSFLHAVNTMPLLRLQGTVCGQMVKKAVSFVRNKSLLIVCRLDQCPILPQLSSQSVLPPTAQPPFISAGRYPAEEKSFSSNY